jgi:cytochrome P450
MAPLDLSADRPAAAVDAARAIPLDEIGLSDRRIWRREIDRYELWRRFRDERPVAFHAELEMDGFPAGPGYWSVTRFDDVRHVSRHPELFRSGQGFMIPDLPTEIAEFYGSMLALDAPRHTRLRLIVNRSFTPRQVARIDADVDAKAAAIVQRAREAGEFDFVEQVAAALPLEIICEMMGIPRSQWDMVFRNSNVILSGGDPEYITSFDDLLRVSLELAALAEELAKARLADPTDDLTTALMHAEVDGERLSSAELASFFILLVVAGNETTRNALSQTLWQLTVDPEQRAVWSADLDGVTPTAVEEIVRFASPVMHFRRTAVEDTTIGEQPVKAGDKVVMWLASADRDERAFADPDRFDVRRTPNDHVGFGAGGPHHCLGANLARREISVMMRRLLRDLPGLEVTAEPSYLWSAFINGIKHLPCRVR